LILDKSTKRFTQTRRCENILHPSFSGARARDQAFCGFGAECFRRLTGGAEHAMTSSAAGIGYKRTYE